MFQIFFKQEEASVGTNPIFSLPVFRDEEDVADLYAVVKVQRGIFAQVRFGAENGSLRHGQYVTVAAKVESQVSFVIKIVFRKISGLDSLCKRVINSQFVYAAYPTFAGKVELYVADVSVR